MGEDQQELVEQLLDELDMAQTEWGHYQARCAELEAREEMLHSILKEWLDLALPALIELRNQLEK